MHLVVLVVVSLSLLTSVASAGDALVNASFEDGMKGWSETIGATTGSGVAHPEVEIDDAVARDGERSVRVTGTADAVAWPLYFQSVVVRPGDRVSLRVAARCEGVLRTASQYANSNATLMFKDASGRRVGFLTSPVLGGEREWVDLCIDAIAPADAATAEVGFFHSMSGSAWFDDVRVTVAPTDPADPSARAAAFDSLAGHLRRTYPFWGLEGKPDADALFATHRGAALAAEDLASFAGALRGMLAELDDVHIWMDTPLGRVGTAAPGPSAQFDIHAVLARIDEKLLHGRNVLAGWIGKGDDRIGYLLVASFALPDDEVAMVDSALTTFADAPAVIVDVRPNGGGDERQAMRIATRFTDEDVVYARQVFRDPTQAALDGFGSAQDRILHRAQPGVVRVTGRANVLSGPGCISSTEGFLLMCKALPRVTVVGQPSRGASGNPGAFEVFRGLTVWSSRWQALDMDNACIEGVGVPPDVVVAPAPRGAENADPVLDRAVELLRE